jgi:DNA-binding response OmpR family regulator
METICIVDDEPNIIELARLYLEREGFRVISAGRGTEGLALIASSGPDLVILDIMLPDIDGLEVLKRLRRLGRTPVLMLSARREDIDKILGLELGADDYLTKPFNPYELLARVKAILRRCGGTAPNPMLELGRLRIDTAGHEVKVGGKPIELRTKEFALLLALAEQPGVVFSREKLLNQVWGYDYYGDTRTVDVHINHLRARLENSGVEIETLRGTGYKLALKEAAL